MAEVLKVGAEIEVFVCDGVPHWDGNIENTSKIKAKVAGDVTLFMGKLRCPIKALKDQGALAYEEPAMAEQNVANINGQQCIIWTVDHPNG